MVVSSQTITILPTVGVVTDRTHRRSLQTIFARVGLLTNNQTHQTLPLVVSNQYKCYLIGDNTDQRHMVMKLKEELDVKILDRSSLP